ncbi:tetratricopeptide repeat protein [Mesoterricola sediminis]|uniref:Tetratricopeptide repeat protein n=1 Tax=Mesoterricola sediminis TaxID=2927980 RepID=A0AA48H3A4_9BACT|nr:tetratricopeptide repeat protein [Mesoterricola sediminis]BDU78812.1 hypothetical protein METESE_37700 [Mesoterricola sediminis]
MIALFLTWALAAGPLPMPEPLPAAALREDAGDALLREAKNLRYAGRWYEAAVVYRRFLAEHRASTRVPEARFWLAASLESNQQWDAAAAAYTEFLDKHPDQRLLGKEAKLNRIRCWGITQGQVPQATPGLVAALNDPTLEVQVAAALQLAKTGDARSVPALRRGLEVAASADACSLALLNLGVKPSAAATPATRGRFLVIRIREAGKPDTVTIRLALSLARAVVNYMSDAQIKEARAKGVDLESLTDQAVNLPKGSVLLSVEDPKSSIEVKVE